MENNTPVSRFAVHDIVVVEKKAREGAKETWYTHRKLGVITSISDSGFTMLEPDRSEYEYSQEKVDENYFFVVSNGSPVEYEDGIAKSIKEVKRSVENAQESLKEMEKWMYDFKYSISIIGKMASFVRSFVNR